MSSNMDLVPFIKREPGMKLEPDNEKPINLASLPLAPLSVNSIIEREDQLSMFKAEQNVDTKPSVVNDPDCKLTKKQKQLAKQEHRREKRKRQRHAKKLRNQAAQAAQLAQTIADAEKCVADAEQCVANAEQCIANAEQCQANSKPLLPTSYGLGACLPKPEQPAQPSHDSKQPLIKPQQAEGSSREYGGRYSPTRLERGILYEMNDPHVLDLFKRYSGYECWWENRGTALAVVMTMTTVNLIGRVTLEVSSHRGWRLEDEKRGSIEKYRRGDGWGETLRNLGGSYIVRMNLS